MGIVKDFFSFGGGSSQPKPPPQVRAQEPPKAPSPVDPRVIRAAQQRRQRAVNQGRNRQGTLLNLERDEASTAKVLLGA